MPKKTLKPVTYTDHKGRLRWHCNDELGEKLKQLYNFLIIGNYEESHAARYPRLAHSISRHPESVLQMKKEDRLRELAGVSETISTIISELLETGTCKKREEGDEFFDPPPKSVLELTKIPRLGAKTARTIYQDHGIESLKGLEQALAEGSLGHIKGIGKGMVATIEKHLASIK